MASTTKINLQLRHWPIIRWVKLAMGLMFVAAGMDGNEPVIAVFGGLLAASSIFGISRCDNGCAMPFSSEDLDSHDKQGVKDGN
ncbi:MAG: hypothetical protein IPN95_05510 [Bacteroidetes bacterium]|nr:hypothetical protein [Bacteroidota bacterium]MBL0018582.1 hypothetical protein [Bacteroidota bacterium]MBP6638837.1 hypothetical protein [Bacteroidia bacterium]MBP6720896.1 hypothetical protein [Bacteroidia bacterium]